MTQPLDPTLLSRLKALHEKATPEPWNTEHYGTFVSGPVISHDWDWIVVSGDSLNDEDDFGERLIPNNEFIAALRNAWPAILAHIEAQDKRLSAVSGLVEALEKILRAHDSGNNGAYMGEATLCQYFAEMARAALAAWRKNHG